MTKLELVQRLARYSGISDSGPSSTTGLVGDELRLVNNIDDAYQAIQNVSTYWLFLRDEFSLSLVAGTSTYSDATVKAWLDSSVTIYSTDYSDEQEIIFVPWEEFKRTRRFGSSRTTTGRPTEYTIKPDNSIMFYPIPDGSYTCTGEYQSVNDTMSGNSAEPIFHEDYHMIVVWHALIYSGAYSGEGDLWSHGQDEYKRLLRAMKKVYLPTIGLGDPLA